MQTEIRLHAIVRNMFFFLNLKAYIVVSEKNKSISGGSGCRAASATQIGHESLVLRLTRLRIAQSQTGFRPSLFRSRHRGSDA
jgi:hypothetical protein